MVLVGFGGFFLLFFLPLLFLGLWRYLISRGRYSGLFIIERDENRRGILYFMPSSQFLVIGLLLSLLLLLRITSRHCLSPVVDPPIDYPHLWLRYGRMLYIKPHYQLPPTLVLGIAVGL